MSKTEKTEDHNLTVCEEIFNSIYDALADLVGEDKIRKAHIEKSNEPGIVIADSSDELTEQIKDVVSSVVWLVSGRKPSMHNNVPGSGNVTWNTHEIQVILQPLPSKSLSRRHTNVWFVFEVPSRNDEMMIKDIRMIIKEALETISGSKKKRMPFEELLELEKRLEQNLVDGKISGKQYAKEWDEVLKASGWTPDEYDEEQDRRWDYVDVLRATPEKPHYVN